MVCYVTIGNQYSIVLDDDSSGELPLLPLWYPGNLRSFCQSAYVLGFLLKDWASFSFSCVNDKGTISLSSTSQVSYFSFLSLHFCYGHTSFIIYGRQEETSSVLLARTWDGYVGQCNTLSRFFYMLNPSLPPHAFRWLWLWWLLRKILRVHTFKESLSFFDHILTIFSLH